MISDNEYDASVAELKRYLEGQRKFGRWPGFDWQDDQSVGRNVATALGVGWLAFIFERLEERIEALENENNELKRKVSDLQFKVYPDFYDDAP